MDSIPAERIDALKLVIERHPGVVPAYLQFVIPDRSRTIMPLPSE